MHSVAPGFVSLFSLSLSLSLSHTPAHTTQTPYWSAIGVSLITSLSPPRPFHTHHSAAVLVRDRRLTNKPIADIFDHVQRLRGVYPARACMLLGHVSSYDMHVSYSSFDMYNVLEVAREKLERRFPQASKISVDVAARYVKKKKRYKNKIETKSLKAAPSKPVRSLSTVPQGA
jgi:hypothetical protein